MPVRVGLVGYGLAGRVFHAPLIRAVDGLELAAVMTSREGPDAPVVSELDALIDAAELVVVAAPHREHARIAGAALDAGRHVIVDKPLAVTAGEAAVLAARGDGRLTVFHNRRWDGDFLTVRARLPELGTVVRFESRYERFRPVIEADRWREDPDPAVGGGVLMDYGVHLVDQALVAFGPVEGVYGEARRMRPGARVDDDAFVALRHAGGVVSHLWLSTVAPAPGPRFRVTGLADGFEISGMDPQQAQIEAGVPPGGAGYGIDPARGGDLLAGDWAAFYRGVVAWVREGAPPPVDPADAVAGLRVLEAARAAAEAAEAAPEP